MTSSMRYRPAIVVPIRGSRRGTRSAPSTKQYTASFGYRILHCGQVFIGQRSVFLHFSLRRILEVARPCAEERGARRAFCSTMNAANAVRILIAAGLFAGAAIAGVVARERYAPTGSLPGLRVD